MMKTVNALLSSDCNQLIACLKKIWIQRRIHKTFFLILSVLILVVGLLISYTTLAFNRTESLPYRFFLIIHNNPTLEIGALIAFQHPVLKQTTIKRIAGLPGDRLEIKDTHVWINEVCLGPVLSNTRDGNPLTPINSQIIPEGCVFAYSPHPKSFDSRYAQVGLVHETQIQGTAYGLF